MSEVDEDTGAVVYRAEINDPALSNAGQTHCVFEILGTYHQWNGEQQTANYKLAKSILMTENLPNEFLGLSPLQLVKQIKGEQSSW